MFSLNYDYACVRQTTGTLKKKEEKGRRKKETPFFAAFSPFPSSSSSVVVSGAKHVLGNPHPLPGVMRGKSGSGESSSAATDTRSNSPFSYMQSSGTDASSRDGENEGSIQGTEKCTHRYVRGYGSRSSSWTHSRGLKKREKASSEREKKAGRERESESKEFFLPFT